MSSIGLAMDMEYVDGITPMLDKSILKIDDVKPLFRIIGVRMVASLKRNIKEGGRPRKWKGTHGGPKTIRFDKKGNIQPGQIGRDKGLMFNSIQIQDLTDGYVAIGPGTKTGLWFDQGTRPHKISAKRAKSLHFFTVAGRNQRGRAVSGAYENFPKSVNHPGTIPRPFVMFQDSDKLYIDRMTLKFIDKAFGVK